MTYEEAKARVGGFIKISRKHNDRDRRHDTPAMLVDVVSRTHALVKPKGHRHAVSMPIEALKCWKSRDSRVQPVETLSQSELAEGVLKLGAYPVVDRLTGRTSPLGEVVMAVVERTPQTPPEAEKSANGTPTATSEPPVTHSTCCCAICEKPGSRGEFDADGLCAECHLIMYPPAPQPAPSENGATASEDGSTYSSCWYVVNAATLKMFRRFRTDFVERIEDAAVYRRSQDAHRARTMIGESDSRRGLNSSMLFVVERRQLDDMIAQQIRIVEKTGASARRWVEVPGENASVDEMMEYLRDVNNSMDALNETAKELVAGRDAVRDRLRRFRDMIDGAIKEAS